MSQRIVRLNPSNTAVAGTFPEDADHVFFLCDTSSADFAVVLPDCRAGNQHQFIFKNTGSGKVTVNATPGQWLDATTSHVLNQFESVTFFSDLKSHWHMM
jgi:hypothetical protein